MTTVVTQMRCCRCGATGWWRAYLEHRRPVCDRCLKVLVAARAK